MIEWTFSFHHSWRESAPAASPRKAKKKSKAKGGEDSPAANAADVDATKDGGQ